MTEDLPEGSRHPTKHHKLGVITLVITTLLLILAGIYYFQPQLVDQIKSSNSQALPAAVIKAAPFPVYYYPGQPPAGFKLDKASVRFDNTLLSFKMTSADGSKSVTVTEQALPASLENSTVHGKETVEGVDGNATVSFDGTRTIGYFIDKDKKSFVIINSPGSIETTTVKDLLRELRTVR